MSYTWEEDDFPLPRGVKKMGQKKPNCNKTYIMYHGTTRKNAVAIKKTGFRQSADGMLGRGVYLSRDLNKASRYPLDCHLSERVVFRVKVNVGDVIAIDRQDHPRQKNWHDGRCREVFDTAWCPPDCGMTASGLEEDCVWDPERITIDRCIAPTPFTNDYDCVLQAHSYSKMSYTWEEDDFQLPYGVEKMGQKKPNCNKTYIMYHGTTRTNAEAIKKTGFRQSEDGMLGRGVYLSRDLNKASRYPLDPRLPDSERVVFRVKVNVGNVIAIDRQRHPRQKNWHDDQFGEVFDTAWCPPDCGMTASGLEEDCVWDPNRITIVRCIAPTPCGRMPSTKKPNCNNTYIMYHGTTRTTVEAIKKTGFRQSEDGMLGRGVYLSRDLNKASRYPLDCHLSERVVFRVKVNVGNVIAINRQGHPRQKNWHDGRYGEVYDTAWCPPDCGMTKSGLEEDCVWDPERITIDRCIAPTPCVRMPSTSLYK
ncbi:unnamed protein product [Lota lota]